MLVDNWAPSAPTDSLGRYLWPVPLTTKFWLETPLGRGGGVGVLRPLGGVPRMSERRVTDSCSSEKISEDRGVGLTKFQDPDELLGMNPKHVISRRSQIITPLSSGCCQHATGKSQLRICSAVRMAMFALLITAEDGKNYVAT